MPSNFLVFDRIRALTRQHNIFRSERIYQDQPQIDKLVAGGDFGDPGQATLLDQTNLQINRLERYRDYEMMDQMGEISLALDLYADEGSLCDPERKRCLIIRARNKRIKRALEDLYFNILNWDSNCRSTIRYLCKFGDAPFEVILNKDRTGVSSLKHINVYNFTRVETRYGDLVGFFHTDLLWPKPVFMHPWQMMHLRLNSFENWYYPYGCSIINGSRRAFRQLRLLEDAALIYRITRAPDRRKFTVPVGNIPPKEVPEYLMMIARTFKRQRFYNPTSGQFDERYSPLTMEDDYFLPRRADGTGPDVESLPGADNVDKVGDIEYFKKKMVAPLKIPFARVGIGEGAGEASEKSLSQSHSEFAKAVQWVQREVATGLRKVGIIHLALQGFSAEDLMGFEVALTATSAMEDLYRMETWQTRTSVMADLKELGWFPKEWIVTHFTDLSPDEIEELREMEQTNANGGTGGGGGGGFNIINDLGNEEEQPLQGQENEAALEIPEEGQNQAAPMEGYDVEAERRLLREFVENNDRKRVNALLIKWAKRLGKPLTKDDNGLYSGYKNMLESKEFDGLSKKEPQSTILESEITIPKEDDDIIFEWTTNTEDGLNAISEVYKLLMADQRPVLDDDSTEIVPDDIPSAV